MELNYDQLLNVDPVHGLQSSFLMPEQGIGNILSVDVINLGVHLFSLSGFISLQHLLITLSDNSYWIRIVKYTFFPDLFSYQVHDHVPWTQPAGWSLLLYLWNSDASSTLWNVQQSFMKRLWKTISQKDLQNTKLCPFICEDVLKRATSIPQKYVNISVSNMTFLFVRNVLTLKTTSVMNLLLLHCQVLPPRWSAKNSLINSLVLSQHYP